MRVGVIGPTGPDLLADNILHCLPMVGVEGVALGPATPLPRNRTLRAAADWARRQSAETEEWFQRSLVTRVREAHCDVVISVQQSLMPGTVAKIKSGGPRVALWFPDCIGNVGRLAMVAADYDALFLKDPLFVERLRNVYGMPAFYLPEACNPDWHKPIGRSSSSPFIVVVGNLYPTRTRLLTRLYEAGIPLKLYGSSFPRWYSPGPIAKLGTGPHVTRQDKSRVFREASGVLNNLHPAEMNSVNARLFEATAAGGAVLCEDRDVLKDLYNVGQEVLSYSTFDELIDLSRLILADSQRARLLGDAASTRAHADHTYQKRLRALLDELI